MTPTGGARDDSRKPPRLAASMDASDGRDAAALPRVLSETVNALSTEDVGAPWHAVLSADDRQRLIDVVRARGSHVRLDLALAIDLVGAVIPQALVAIAEGPESQRRLMEVIARSLLEDPQSARRLEALIVAIHAETGNRAGAME
jgi:hypothetical protein